MNDQKNTPYDVLAYYYFGEIKDPKEEVRQHKEFFKERDITARIYISEEGINGQMSGIRKDAQEYIEWMHGRPQFKDIYFKIHEYHEQAFPRCVVKYREKLVGIDDAIDLSKGGKHVEPNKWKEMIESGEYQMIDVRNDYEWKVGHFEGAILPKCNTFREFSAFADTMEDKKKPVMMYCTGGIRCELYSAVLKDKGFGDIYQLNGGVINYGLKEGNEHWKGKLFVFDDRLAVPISEETPDIISQCHHCDEPSDSYHNCANMDCNDLFLSCPSCFEEHQGCCKDECKCAKRVRPLQKQDTYKPFRKKHLLTGS